MSANPFVDFDDRSRSELEHQLTVWWQEIFGLRDIRPDQDFFELGGDSLLGARLLAKIAEKYGFKLGILTLYDAQTIVKLADLIQLKQASAERWCIVPIRAEGSLPPLFLVHGVGGNVLGFFHLVKRLHAEQPVYGIQAQALQSEGPTFIQLRDMATYYIREMRRVQPEGPYSLLGHSFGGLVAYEMAQQLHAAGEEMRMLGMIDTWPPSYQRRLPNSGSVPTRIYRRLQIVWLNTRRLRFSSKFRYAGNRLRAKMLRAFYHYSAASGKTNLNETMKSVHDINLVAGINYKVLPYAGRVTLFRATEQDIKELPEDLGWRGVARGGVEIHRLPGDHGQVLAEPSVALLAEQLTECLLRNQPRVEIEI